MPPGERRAVPRLRPLGAGMADPAGVADVPGPAKKRTNAAADMTRPPFPSRRPLMNDNSLLEPKDSQPKDSQPQNAAPGRGVIATLWNGDYSLATTFWVFGVLVRTLMWMILKVLQILEIVSNTGPWLLVGTALLLTVLDVCILVGLWRSASKYTGFRLWPILVKALVILIVFSNAILVGQTYYAVLDRPYGY